MRTTPANHAGLKTARVARYTAVGDARRHRLELVLVGNVGRQLVQRLPDGRRLHPVGQPVALRRQR